jgi:hypothetical protein
MAPTGIDEKVVPAGTWESTSGPLPPGAEEAPKDDISTGQKIDEAVERHRTAYSGYMATLQEIRRLYMGKVHKETDSMRVAGEKKEPKALIEHGTLDTNRCVESSVSSGHAMTFSDDPWIEPYGIGIGDEDMALAHRVRANMNRQHYEAGFRSVALDLRRWCYLYGTVIAKTTWEQKNFLIERPEGWVQETSFDGPRFSYVPMWRFHWLDDGKECNTVSWVCEEVELTEEQIKKLIDAGKDYRRQKEDEEKANGREIGGHGIVIHDWEAIKKAAGENSNETAEAIRQESGRSGESDAPYLGYLWWGVHPTLKSKKDPTRPDERSWYIISVKGVGPIFEAPALYAHGGNPYDKATIIREDETFTGWGMGTIARLPQIAMNKRMMTIDKGIALATFGMYTRTGGPPNKATEAIKVSPCRTFDDVVEGAIKPMTINLQGIAPAMQMNAYEANGIQYATGGTMSEQAAATGGTAREYVGVSSVASRRAGTTAENFGDQLLRPMLYKQDSMNGQFLGKDFSFTWYDERGNMVNQKIPGNYPAGKFRWLIKYALDIEFRPKIIRQTTQVMAQLVSLLAIGKDSATVGPLLLSVTLPGIMQFIRKVALMSNVNPDDALSPESVKMVLAAINPAAQAMAAQPPEGPPPQPGMPTAPVPSPEQQQLMAAMAAQGGQPA